MIDRLRKRADALEQKLAPGAGGLNWRLAVMPARLTAEQRAEWRASEVEPLERVGERVFILRLVAGAERSSGWLQ